MPNRSSHTLKPFPIRKAKHAEVSEQEVRYRVFKQVGCGGAPGLRSLSNSRVPDWMVSQRLNRRYGWDYLAPSEHFRQGRPMIKLKAFVYGKLGAAFILAFAGLLLGAGAKLIGQSLFWLKNGYWESYSILRLLLDFDIVVPTTPKFLGVQKIIDDVVSWPALVGVGAAAGLSVIIGAFFIALGEQYESELDKQAEAALKAKSAREARERRRADAERSREDFDFAEPIERLRSDKRPFAEVAHEKSPKI